MVKSKKRVLVTGGAGFVGSSLALYCKRDHPEWEVLALDNLSREGSVLNLERLRQGGVGFQHGDVRNPEDLASLGAVDILIECSAEPSVHAGYGGDPRYLVNTNLVGAINCLEHLRITGGQLIFISTSRVYPIAALRALPLQTLGKRFVLGGNGGVGRGWSAEGITEDFPLEGARSLYGATKLSAELLIAEYSAMYDIPAVINRCGVLTGPWQMGKVDQGFVALWMARHVYQGALSYMGFGGDGHQVRDILHVADLYELIALQISDATLYQGQVFNVGGGSELSLSLAELTDFCQQRCGTHLTIGKDLETRAADIPYFVTDATRIKTLTGWQPGIALGEILDDMHRWIVENKNELAPVFRA